jgi:hypothetical protein
MITGFLKVWPAGSMDPAQPMDRPLSSSYPLNTIEDIAVLEIVEGQIPPNTTAALPSAAPQSEFEAVFFGINGAREPDPELKYLPTIENDTLRKAIENLMLFRLFSAGGIASFSSIIGRSLEHGKERNADLITYRTSTTAGASGSALAIPNCRFF